MTRNRLDQETSPYLLQHKNNPVHWQPWDPAALAEATAKNKPILLSIGYAACHWCHVMAHESFEDAATAAVMNELFVTIKVDREERPDLDTIYQAALALLGQQGGWPLTMFLTPAGEPFWGGTYFPNQAKYGRPAFTDVLRYIRNVYDREPDKVDQNRAALRQALDRLSQPAPGGEITPESLEQVAERLLQEVDPLHGGINGAPKFPQPMIFELLWRAHRRTRAPATAAAVVRTLERMAQGGIYDHLGGGFARYSTDAHWLAPHFEKMLYDNALLLHLMTLVWQNTRMPLLEARIRETVAWTLREMVAAGGAFAATIDADSEGEEGRFYVWTLDEINRLLGADAPLFAQAYDVSEDGNWEGHTILNRSRVGLLPSAEAEARLGVCRQVLLQARGRRVRPGWDDKVLADWNGLMIAALAEAGAALGEDAWLAAARRAFAAIVRHMEHPGGRLSHSFRDGRARHAGMLEDYANMAAAALALFETTGEPALLAHARTWVQVLDRHFWDSAGGGYFFTAADAESLITRSKTANDNATPNGNGTMVGVLARLWHLTGEAPYRDRAEAVVAAFSGHLQRNFFPLAHLINHAQLLGAAVQVVVIGDRSQAATDHLLRAVFGASLPNRILQVIAPDTALPTTHPAAGKTAVAGAPTAYVCVGTTCSLPLTVPAALAAALAETPG
ncbi:MAG: thioredoxin domain-containing protein [Alphaproteobacteria bacterium]|nr:thioredoxin domain-containing protein [Alphaproteobacteria bacterium]